MQEITPRIALFSYCFFPYEYGGGERSTRLLAKSLQENGFEVAIFSIAPAKENEGWHEVDSLRVFRAPLDNFYYYPNAKASRVEKAAWHFQNQFLGGDYRVLLDTVANFRPDIIAFSQLTGFAPQLIFKIKKILPVPMVYTGRDYVLIDPRTTLFERGKTAINTVKQKFFTIQKRRATKVFDAMVFNSQRTREIHERVLPWIVNKSRVIYTDPPSGSPRTKTFKEKEKYRAVIIGKLSEEKGVLQALTILRNAPNLFVEVVIAGEGPLREAVEKICQADFRFSYVGVANGDAKTELLDSCDFLIQPSLWEEPFPRVILEGFFHRLCVIATNHGGNGELLDSGKRGTIFDMQKPESLIAALSPDPSEIDNWNCRLDAGSEFIAEMQQKPASQAYSQVFYELIRKRS